MSHVTRDMFGGVNILSKFQLPSSYCLWFMILWRSGGKGWLNESMNDVAVYRTAPAIPGLLKRGTIARKSPYTKRTKWKVIAQVVWVSINMANNLFAPRVGYFAHMDLKQKWNVFKINDN